MIFMSLLMAIMASAMLNIMSSLFGRYNTEAKNTSYLYSLIVTGSASVTWSIICLLNEGIRFDAVVYSLIFGLFNTVGMIGMFQAYRIGSVSLTAFIKQISLLAVSVWGLLFWGNSFGINIAIGMVLITVALYLCLKSDKADFQKPSLSWYLFALMLLIGNAGASIMQKYQQITFHGTGGHAFMFFGTAISFGVSLVLYLKNFSRRPKNITKHTLLYPVIAGISSALLNLLVLRLLFSPLSESIIYPGIAVGGLCVTMLFSLAVFKERLSTRQWFGLLVGAVALVFLNIA